MRLHIGILAVAESVCAFASFYGGAYLRFKGNFVAASGAIGSLAISAAVFAGVLVVSLLAVGLYRGRRPSFSETLLRLGTAFVLAAFVDASLYYLIPPLSTWRGHQALALGIAFIGLLVMRRTFYSVIDNDRFRRRVLVYGHGVRAASLARSCVAFGQRGFRIEGFIRAAGESASSECVPLLPRNKTLEQYVRDMQIDEIVVAMDNRRERFPSRELLDCRLAGIRVSDAVTFLERETGRIDLEALQPSWLIYGNGFRHGGTHKVLKRLFDVIVSIVLLIVALPALLLAAAAILVESRGKGGVLYTQARVGRHGRVFRMIKLRSMIVEAESDGTARWASEQDPRVTKVGAVLRRLRIDELPQVVNVLRGEMSFVGPRPERPEFVEQLSRQIPFYGDRHCVKPGLTGWAQLCFPYGSSVEDARQKLQYELFYIKNYSLAFDALILLQTLDVVLWGRAGSREPSTSEPALGETTEGRHAA